MSLASQKKIDLVNLATELDLQVSERDTIKKIVKTIEDDANFNKDFTNDLLKNIVSDRIEKEKGILAEKEAERLEKEAERLEKQNERDFELKKLQLQKEADNLSLNSARTEPSQRISLKNIMQKFDEGKSDISLFLNLFEKQAEKAGIEESHYTTHLMPLLPVSIAEIVLRESEDKFDDFESVKNLLLKRYKLSPENLRTKFVTHQKQPNALWKDLCFDLQNFLDGWTDGLKITDFEGLKKLMIADQLKKRASAEAKEHFIDSWAEFTDPLILAEKLDNFDLVRKPMRKHFWSQNKFEKKGNFENKNHPNSKIEHASEPVKNDTESKATTPMNWRDRSEKEKTKAFEKKEIRRCFLCNSTNHTKRFCRLNKSSTGMVNFINADSEFDSAFQPYLSKGKVNEKDIIILRDTGSSIDVVGQNFIDTNCFNGEHIWLKQPLDASVRCLPLADIKLQTESGTVITKAAVLNRDIPMNHYLLGNETSKILQDLERKPKLINAITRSQAKITSQIQPLPGTSAEQNSTPSVSKVQAEEKIQTENIHESKPAEQDESIVSDSDDEPIFLPSPDKDEITELAHTSSSDFKEKQKNDPNLSSLWEKAKQGSKQYQIRNNLLVRITKDHLGNERKQVIVPSDFRPALLKNAHCKISGHLGATKSKDKLLRYFFWPNAIKEMENYVKECDPCQRIGKAGEKKKAPLKLIPIISEIFAHLSVDITGPLPISERNNKYLLTALCCASKYPEAIPLPDIKSEAVVDGMMQIFSRFGFARSIQTDLGRSFVSALTSTFAEKFGVQIKHSSIAHPESNIIERFHRSVKRLLKVMCIESQESWERNLPYALLALRTVTHESTGFSPAELVHGKNLRTPETLLFESWTEEGEQSTLVTEYVFELLNRLKKCQELAKLHMEDAQFKRKLWFDKNAVVRKFNVGDKVLVLATIKPNKFSVNWIGPGTVVKQISETNYIVNVPGRRQKEQIFHINLLKPYHGRTNLVNILISEKWDPNSQEVDLDIVYPTSDPEIFDFQEIVRTSDLENHCSPEQIQNLGDLLGKFRDVFSNNPGRTDWVTHDIEVLKDTPIRMRPYRTSPRQNEILRKEVKRMLDLGIIIEGESDYTSPMILVEAPGKDPRPCIDYRRLNAITKAEYFPLPNIEERVEKVAKAKYITVVDLTKGYWQVPLTPRAQRLAAFVTTWGSFLPQTLPFGLLNASFQFSKFMGMLLKGLDDFCLPYLDDIAIFSNTWSDHLAHLETVLGRIREAKLKIKLAKCQFACRTVKYLGHVIGEGKRSPAQAKIDAILKFPTPKNKTDIRKFLGLSGYYSRYVKDYALIAEPLTRSLKGKIKKEAIDWDSEMESAFLELKSKLTSKPILFSPDYSQQFIVQTDASDKGLGVVLAQRPDNEEHPVLYLSRKFTGAELNYATTEKECAAIIFAIKKLRLYLDGQKFIIETDHNPLIWLKNNTSTNQRLLRWALTLQPYNYEIRHRPGKAIPHVDCLSRL